VSVRKSIQNLVLGVACVSALSVLSVPALAQNAAPSGNKCESGQAQSPVNIDKYRPADLLPLGIDYKTTPLDVVNTGHTVQMFFEPGSKLTVGGREYGLYQMEFYTPSEHYLNGAPYPMEMQFVHQAADRSLGIVSVFVKVGEHNKYLQGLWDNIPMSGERRKVERVKLSAQDLMPEDKAYYTYEGSLTVRPCMEGVQWYILKNPIEMSVKQLRKFEEMFPRNARMIQPLNGRIVKGSQ